MELLKGIQSPAVSTVILAYLSSPNAAFQSAGVAIGLAQGRSDALANLIRLWPSISKDPASLYVVNSLRDSYRDTSPASVRQIADISADSRFAELRPAALRALAFIHTKEALPSLAALLESADRNEQMLGVIGLSAFANGCPVQTSDNVVSLEYLQFRDPSPYRTPETIANFAFRRGPAEQEAELISFWRNWWNANERELIK